MLCESGLVVQGCVNEKSCVPVTWFTALMMKENVPMNDGSRQLGSSAILRFFFGLIALAALNGVKAEQPEERHDEKLSNVRIACFNVESLTIPDEWSRFAHFRFPLGRMRHLESVAAVIEAVNPDVLVLSEVSSRESCEALVTVLREKGLGDFQAYHVDGRDSYTGFDVAIVSRLKPDRIEGKLIHLFAPDRTPRLRDVQQGTVPLPWTAERYTKSKQDGEDVEAIAVVKRHSVCFISVFGHKLGLVGLHLKSNPSDPEANAQRTAEAAIVQRIVQREIISRGYAPIILGDINDYDPDVEMADATRETQTSVLRMLKNCDPHQKGDELINIASHIPRVADRFSSHWDYNENDAADSDDVFTLIDHILIDRRLSAGIKRAFICHASSLDTSDHFPVIVDIDFSLVSVDP